MADIVIFGDSIAWGAYDSEKGGWVNRLKLFVEQSYAHETYIYNCAISGETSDGILAYLDSEARTREASHIIVAIGINDSSYDATPGNNKRCPFDVFSASIPKLVESARAITPNVIFLGSTRVDESKTQPIPWRKNVFYSNAEIERYEKVIKDVCVKENIQFLNMADLLENTDVSDGLHPNEVGHQKIFERVRDSLKGKWW